MLSFHINRSEKLNSFDKLIFTTNKYLIKTVLLLQLDLIFMSLKSVMKKYSDGCIQMFFLVTSLRVIGMSISSRVK